MLFIRNVLVIIIVLSNIVLGSFAMELVDIKRSELPSYATTVLTDDNPINETWYRDDAGMMMPVLHYALYKHSQIKNNNIDQKETLIMVINALLIHKGASPSITDEFGNTAIHFAIELNAPIEVIEAMLRKVDPNIKNSFIEDTLIHTTVNSILSPNNQENDIKDKKNILLKLLENNVSPYLTNKLGETVFHMIAHSGKKDLAEILLFPSKKQKDICSVVLMINKYIRNNNLGLLPHKIVLRVFEYILPQYAQHGFSSTAKGNLSKALAIKSKEISRWNNITGQVLLRKDQLCIRTLKSSYSRNHNRFYKPELYVKTTLIPQAEVTYMAYETLFPDSSKEKQENAPKIIAFVLPKNTDINHIPHEQWPTEYTNTIEHANIDAEKLLRKSIIPGATAHEIALKNKHFKLAILFNPHYFSAKPVEQSKHFELKRRIDQLSNK